MRKQASGKTRLFDNGRWRLTATRFRSCAGKRGAVDIGA
jgi:hypothetical protein